MIKISTMTTSLSSYDVVIYMPEIHKYFDSWSVNEKLLLPKTNNAIRIAKIFDQQYKIDFNMAIVISLYYFRNGIRNPIITRFSIQKLCEFYDCDVDEVVDLIIEMDPYSDLKPIRGCWML